MQTCWLTKSVNNNCGNTRVFVHRREGHVWNFRTALKVTAASVITAAFYAAAAFLPVTKPETRPTLSQSPLSLHPHGPQDRVTPHADPHWPLSVRGSMSWVREPGRAAPVSDSPQRWDIARPVGGLKNDLTGHPLRFDLCPQELCLCFKAMVQMNLEP